MKKKLIYIIGAGRSGTTLLDIMLGNMSDAVSLGEINRFYKRNGVPPKRTTDSKTYIFWRRIKDQIKPGKSILNNENKLVQKNEYHTAFLKGMMGFADPKYKGDLLNMYTALYNSLEEKIIIESSKYPTRALNLANSEVTDHFDLNYIYLRKDPVRVVNSFQKKNLEQPSKSFFKANIYYLTINLLCTFALLILKLKGQKTYTITYRDLVSNSEKTLLKAQKKLDIDTTDLIDQIKSRQPLKTGLLFDGNRIRLNETVVLVDQERKTIKDFRYYFTRFFNYIIYR